MNIKNFISNLINTLLDGSFERVRIINQMNTAFKEYFTCGEFNRLCRVSISQGCSEYAHEAFKVRLGAVGNVKEINKY
jgi:hypothetical protein